MLVFIDESGDSGLKIVEGSSSFFTVALVVFEDHEEATACNNRIELLKRELGWNSKSEFHFKANSDTVREMFLKAVSPYSFFYYGIVMNKKSLYGEGFKDKNSFYKYACSLVFENAKDKLDEAIIVIDKSGSLEFKRQMERYLKKRINQNGKKAIRKVKMQNSHSNNLLQLADYIAGVMNRSKSKTRKEPNKYRNMISHREIYVQTWPKV